MTSIVIESNKTSQDMHYHSSI